MDVIKLKNLYRDAFPNDTENYINYFFSKKVKSDKTFVLEDNGEVLSALYLVDKQVLFNGKNISVPYIVAAGTKSEYRGKKLLEKVMDGALNFLNKTRCPFVALFPFKHDYYRKYGFIVSDYSYKLKCDGKGNKLQFVKSNDVKLFLTMYNDYFKNVNCIYRDELIFKQRLEELEAEGGSSYLMLKDGVAKGYVFVSDEIDELVYFDDIADLEKEEFLNNKNSDIFIDLNAGTHQNTMIKICNIEQFLFLLNFKKEIQYDGVIKFKFKHIEDKVLHIKVVNGIILIKNTDIKIYDEEINEETLARYAFNVIQDQSTSQFLNMIIPRKAFFVEKF